MVTLVQHRVIDGNRLQDGESTKNWHVRRKVISRRWPDDTIHETTTKSTGDDDVVNVCGVRASTVGKPRSLPTNKVSHKK
jgi:hypothetical protein